MCPLLTNTIVTKGEGFSQGNLSMVEKSSLGAKLHVYGGGDIFSRIGDFRA
jgi:hypothetical protein